jgi:monomeric sarcosine oxidase
VRDFDVVVVGAGVMGASTARWLSRKPRRVALFEQFEIGHKRGSSHGGSRIFRFSYPDPHFVAQAQEALGLWRALEVEAGADLLTTVGGLDIGPGIAANAAALKACGVRHEWLDGRAAKDRFPMVNFPPGPVLYQPDGAWIAADKTVAVSVGLARRAGAEVLMGTRVVALEPTGDGLTVRTEKDAVTARSCVVTAGGWAKGLLADAGIELDVRPTRETVAYFAGAPAALPTLVEWGAPSRYALHAPGHGLKAGEHEAGPTADPDQVGAVSRTSVERVSEWVAKRFPQAHPVAHEAETCIYTNTPDEGFVLERHGPIVVGSACSGHGFKFAPLIGKRLAELAV